MSTRANLTERSKCMLLSHKTTVKINAAYSNIIGHMCYAAYKLWNICNYERLHYKELNLAQYPDWYYQKKVHRNCLWYKQLPSQTAQEVCKLLDKSWKSFYKLNKTGGIANPKPPRFKQDGIAITYMQKAIVHTPGTSMVRLTISKSLRGYMSETYGIRENFLILENKIFRDADTIKQIKIYPPADGKCEVIIIYEVPDAEQLPDNGKYLSIDMGVHNLMTCLNSDTGESFIVGRKYLSICHYYNKEIARVQSQWSNTQYRHGIKYPKPSKHVLALHKKKNNTINDYLHKATRHIVAYCKENDIHTVIIGDITGIRKDNDHGTVNNQKLHALPYKKIFTMLQYKLIMEGIRIVQRRESYSSQCSPLSVAVSKQYAVRKNRIKRGLYADGGKVWNADCVGAYNILRLYLSDTAQPVPLSPAKIKVPYVAKVAA